MDIKKTLIDGLKDNFQSGIYQRGRNYYTAGAVLGMRAERGSDERITIYGKVRGSRVYDTRLLFDFRAMKFESFECTCPYDYDNCKHSVALGLKFIDALCDFMENRNKEVAPRGQDIEGYINEGDKEAKHIGGLRKTDSQLDNLKKLFTANEKRLPYDVLKEVKRILGMNTEKTLMRIDDFYIDIYFGYAEIEARIQKNGFGGKMFEARYFLNKKEALTKNQIELMEYMAMKNTWQNKLDPITLLLLVKKSGMRYGKISYGTKTSIQIIDNQKFNFSAKLMDKSYFHEYSKKEIINIVFEIDAKHIKKSKMFFSPKGLIVEESTKALICYLPESAIALFKRASEYTNYYDRGKGGTINIQLEEREVININSIIGYLKKSCNLTTNLPDIFDIREHEKFDAKIVVDYDASTQVLEVKAAIDYGIEKQNVGESVYQARTRNEMTLRRRELFPDKKCILKRKGNSIDWAKIKPKKEIKLFRTFYDSLGETGFSKSLILRRKGDDAIIDFYEKQWPHVISICKKEKIDVEYIKDKLEVESAAFKADFAINFDAENDWLKFDIDCYCGEGRITLDVLKKYILEKREIIKNGGKLIRIENKEELEKLILMLESFYQKENQKFEGRVYHAPELEGVVSRSEYYNVKISTSFKKFIQEAQNGKPVGEITIPERIKKILRNYQKDGLYWCYFLRKYRFGGILADDMGLGKTLQALSLVDMNKNKGKPSLVICPKTLLFNWEDETKKFFPAMKTLVVEGSQKERREKLKRIKKHDLIITSYPSIKRDEEQYVKMKFNYCILDEAQYIKNYKTQSAKAVKKMNADYRLALTGTPLENSVSEIWSIFDYLMPGFLGNMHNFSERFEKPIMKNSDGSALEILKKKTACFILRRTKERVLKELPSKIEQVRHCQLSDNQNILYQEILANVRSQVFETVRTKGFSKSQIHILAGLTKLRQVCNHPVLLLKDKDYEKFESAKLELFLEIVSGIVSSGRKVLVFSQFTQMLDILSKELIRNNIGHHYLSGKTKNRRELVRDFNENKDKQIFLISLKAGGTGLNLISADNVIIFDPWWNPSVERQAVDRAHRIGQEKSVNVYRLITKGTIEEKIVKLQEKKKFLFDNLLGDSQDLFQKLTWEEVKDLFR